MHLKKDVEKLFPEIDVFLYLQWQARLFHTFWGLLSYNCKVLGFYS